MPKFQTVTTHPTAYHVPLHELTAYRVSAWKGYGENDVVPIDVACKLQKTGPRARQQWSVNAFMAREYLELHPEHSFPEREVTPLGQVETDRAAEILIGIERLGTPEDFYWNDLTQAVDPLTLTWLATPAGRHVGARALWDLGFEKWPNPNEKFGRWLHCGKQTSRYRRVKE